MSVIETIMDRLMAANLHGFSDDKLALLITHERYADLMRECSPQNQSGFVDGKMFLDTVLRGVEVIQHEHDCIPLDFVDKAAFRKYSMVAVAAQLDMRGGDHSLIVEARRETFDALCRRWVPLMHAEGKAMVGKVAR